MRRFDERASSPPWDRCGGQDGTVFEDVLHDVDVSSFSLPRLAAVMSQQVQVSEVRCNEIRPEMLALQCSWRDTVLILVHRSWVAL